jgi:hypothetical protein
MLLFEKVIAIVILHTCFVDIKLSNFTCFDNKKIVNNNYFLVYDGKYDESKV